MTNMNENTAMINEVEIPYVSPVKDKMTKDDLRRKELKDAMNKAVRDQLSARFNIKTTASMMLNDLLLGRERRTKDQYLTPVAWFDENNGYAPSIKPIKNSENRDFRYHKSVIETVNKTITIKLNSGETIDADTEYTYFTFDKENPPVIFMEFVGSPLIEDPDQSAAHEACKKYIKKGFKYNGNKYEYAFSSASQQRTLKGVFILAGYKIPDEYLAKFDVTIPGCTEYVEFLRGLVGAEAIYEVMTYGGYSMDFMGKLANPAKFGARIGTCHTSTKSLGNDYRVLHIGEVHTVWNAELEEAIKNQYRSYKKDNGDPTFTEVQINKLVAKFKKFWKTQKLDGQSMIRVSAVIRGYAKLGIKLKAEAVIGKLIQLRYAGVKGTALCVPDEMLDVCELPDGRHPYEGYDMIVEHSSWKFTYHADFYTGELAPELELVNISKSKHSNNLNYQFIQALDGDFNRFIDTKAMLHKLIDMKFDLAQQCMQDPEMMKAFLGLISKDESGMNDLDIDDYDRTLTSVLSSALDANDNVIYDKSWRIKFVNKLTKMRDKAGYGKIPVEGANRYIISDPTAMFRTDLAVMLYNKDGSPKLDHFGNHMFDINITSMDQVALNGTTHCHWAGQVKPAVLFRSPCVHPGEPQLVDLVDDSSMKLYFDTAYGVLNMTGLFAAMKDIIVINIFSMILDVMGGADTDGDTVLCVTEPIIVKLRSRRRTPMLTKVESEAMKRIICPETMKDYMIESLKDSGIGRITNWATTFRDIESMMIHMPSPLNGKYRLPSCVVKNLYKLSNEARGRLKEHRDEMLPDEIAVAEALSQLGMKEGQVKLNDDANFKVWRKLVIDICELAMAVLRRLQEMSIDTAKSGVFVEFDDYKYLKLKVRATWLRKAYDPEDNYESWSVMGSVDTYADERWELLRTWATDTAVMLGIAKEFDSSMVQYKGIYETIREYKASFGTDMYNLSRIEAYSPEEDMSRERLDELRRQKLAEICDNYYALLKKLSVEVGSVDVVSVLAYRATYDTDKDPKKADGLSFVWLCWGNEFVSTLRHYNSGTPSTRLVSVRLLPEYKDYILRAADDYIVEDGQLKYILNDCVVTLGYAKVSDGVYSIICPDDTPYLLNPIVKPTVDSMTASLAGAPFRIIGFQYHEYKGVPLSREMVKELLGSTNFVVKAEIDASGRVDRTTGKTEAATLIYVNVGHDAEEWICIGNIPEKGGKKEESGFFSRILHNKKIRVEIPKSADKNDPASRLTLNVAEVLEDYNV